MEIINNENIISDQDDGIVPLESTKLVEMTDIKIIKTNHAFLPKSRIVAEQTIAFLKNGYFKKGQYKN